MKQRTENYKKLNIWKWLAAGSVALVVVVSVACGLFLHWNIWDKSENTDEKVLKAETEAVVNEEKLETRTFLNKPAPAAEAGDNRQVFRIIEVIPHEACSVFPYFVEWKTEKGYDLNTPLGYDGIMMSAQLGSYGGGGGSGFNMFCEEETLAKDSRPFVYIKEKIVKEYFEKLSDYDTYFYSATDQQRGGSWFRNTRDEYTLVQAPYGYFEYVGEGKGLYYINVSLAAGDVFYPNLSNTGWSVTASTSDSINYEIQAVPRKGTESPKGYMYVCDSAYYWSKDSGSNAKPKYNSLDVVGSTDYNYDLKFAEAETGTYVVNNVLFSSVPGDEFSYDLAVDSSDVATWESGFYYQKDGFYKVASCVQAAGGKYVRVADAEKDDGFTDGSLDRGYFLMAAADEYQGAVRYNVTFAEAGADPGCYMAKAPGNYTGDNFTFIYRGEGKGSYKVSFLYSPKSSATDTKKRYMPEIVEVSTGQGAYALTTTSTNGDGKAKYSDTTGVADVLYDYAEVVLNIGASTSKTNDTVDGYSRMGVTVGDTYTGAECGGWVFVPLENADEMQQTFLKDVKKNTFGKNSNTDTYFTPGDRIYVTGQKRVYRFYCKDGLQNNEWFKLLCYSNNPKDETKPYSEMIDGVGYDFEKTVKDNMNNEITKQLIEAFDGQFRIEIIQKEPQYLTVDDVKSADLIYISNQEGINGMSLNWNAISERLEDEDLPYCDWNTYCKLTDEQDISTDVLMALYDECIYERNRALIVAHSVIKEGGDSEKNWPITRNLTKLYYMMNFFDEALKWAYFMPDMYPEVANENFSRIRTPGDYGTATVDVYKGGDYNTFNSVFVEEEETEEKEYPKYNLEQWNNEYFQVWTTHPYSSVVEGFDFQNDIGYWANVVQEGETKLTVKYYLDPLFMDATTKANIWKILKNRKLDNSMLVVEVTNGEITGETVPRRVIYSDEFDPQSFDIKYKVLLLGSSRYPSALTDITLTFEDGSVAGKGSILQYGEENTNNVRHGFTIDGSSGGDLNPSKTVRKVTITATDSNGKTASAEVYVIVREAFMLN